MVVCPFPTDPKYWKIRFLGFFFFPVFGLVLCFCLFVCFLILNFVFLNKTVKIKCQNI